MNDDTLNFETIDRWLLDAREGRADPGDTARISQLLKDRPDLRKHIALRLMDEVLLREELQISAAESLLSEHIPFSEQVVSPRRRSMPRWKAVGYALALSICLAGFIWILVGMRSKPSPIVPGSEANHEFVETIKDTEGVAVLTHAVDVHWGNEVPLRVGERIALQTLRIESGFLQVEFFSGVTVVIEGPAELEVTSPSRCQCRQGKIRVTVPPQATGFTVRAGDVDAVDLGTEFAMQVGGDGNGEVHVLNGKVDMRSSDRKGNRIVEEGKAVRFGAGDGLTDVPARLGAFVGMVKLQDLESSSAEAGYRRWREHSRKWANDPAMAMYFTFDGQRDSDRRLIGKANGSVSAIDGAIVGCRWASGRFEGKGALEFKRTSDRVRVNLEGEYPSLTLFAWLRVDALERRYNSLLLSDGYSPGKVHWQLTGEGALKLSVGGAGSYISPRVIKPSHLGAWVQLATVYDHEEQSVTHYLDGETIATGAISKDLLLTFGPAEIGNWNPLRPKDTAIRSLNGTIDEFALFRRALSKQEIKEAYRAGKP